MSADAVPEADAVKAAGGDGLREHLAAVEERMAEIAAAAPAPLDGWAGSTIAAGGKRLRPTLVYLAASQKEPRALFARALVQAGVAVELVHSATLVHDDVLDAASLRRGAPTVWASAGREAAIATGDYLFARAFGELVAGGDARAVRVLSDASGALAQGELLQREDAFDAAVAVERYLHRCELKTARLFQAACELGALAAGEDPAPIGAFGRRIGLAFQLLDDVLDVSGPTERTGKHRGTDLLDGTVTLPLILAREREPSLGDALPQTAADAEALCDRIAATGALDEARERALAIVAEAKRELPYADEALLLVADSVVARYS